jgi:hypothetical protein
MKIIPLDRRRDVHMLQMAVAELGYNASAEVIERLADLLQAAREERAEAIARLKAEFDRDVEALRGDLAETRALIEALRALKA